MSEQPAITDRDVEDYRRDGVVHVRGAFTSDVIERIEAVIAGLLRSDESDLRSLSDPALGNMKPSDGGYYLEGGPFYASIPAVRHYVHSSSAARIAGRLTRSTQIRYYADYVFARAIASPARPRFHTHMAAWATTGVQQCIVWMPVDEVSLEQSLEFVAGSHLWPESKTITVAGGTVRQDPSFPILPDIERHRSNLDIRRFDMQRGDCLVFHSNIAHGAHRASPRTRRWAIATHWAGDDVRYHPAKPNSVTPGRPPAFWIQEGMTLRGRRFPIAWRDPARPRARWIPARVPLGAGAS